MMSFVIYDTEARERIYLFAYCHSIILHFLQYLILVDALPILDNFREHIDIWFVHGVNFQSCTKPFISIKIVTVAFVGLLEGA